MISILIGLICLIVGVCVGVYIEEKTWVRAAQLKCPMVAFNKAYIVEEKKDNS